ncbi:efflux transporter outer membrane subunit [Pluralibacter gergoviae]|uniref:efflux transporter outer membrane subunit n=1 Tax=Pluralibacter gergoviae TaxID=61647 RepID=UPI000907F72F|nr:efflux transporter outer membrane subunit [Pluralibacter gergoviae]ELN2735811.1 efflux transporter outer membrane subunit [Pluralibacter gergoviae]
MLQKLSPMTRTGPIFIFILLCGCAPVGPDYHPHEPAHPQSWSEPFPSVSVANRARSISWCQSLNDPLLNELIKRTLENNKDLGIARQRLMQARAERDEVASYFGPQLSAGAGASVERLSRALDISAGVRDTRTWQLGLDASWELDIFGRHRRELESADAEVEAVQEEQRALTISLLAEVASDYAVLRTTQQRMTILNDTLRSLSITESLTMKARERGLGTQLEVDQARSEREINEARQPVLLSDELRMIHALGVLSGGFPGDFRSRLLFGGAPQLMPPSLPDSLPSDVIRQRPDIRVAERKYAAASARIGIAVAEQFPHFTISLGVGSSASLLHNLFSAKSIGLLLGANVNETVYNSGRTSSRVRGAEAEPRAMALTYQKSIQLAFQDVEDALAGLHAEQTRQRSLTEAVADSQRAETRAIRLYQRGLSGWLPVLVAQRSTWEARDKLALSQLADFQHTIGLYKAMGSGWQKPENPRN